MHASHVDIAKIVQIGNDCEHATCNDAYAGDTTLQEIRTLDREQVFHPYQQITGISCPLLHVIIGAGAAGEVAHLLTDEDWLQITDRESKIRLIHLIAGNPFPADKFPYHLLSDELLDEEIGLSTTLLYIFASANKQWPIAELPLFHIPIEKLTPHRLLRINTFGRTSVCREVLNHGDSGVGLLLKTRTLDHADPTRLLATGDPVPLDEILRTDANLIKPTLFKHHALAAYTIARRILKDAGTLQENNPRHNDLKRWTAELAQINLGQAAPRKSRE